MLHFVGQWFEMDDAAHPMQATLREYMLTEQNVSELVFYYVGGRESEL